MKLSVGIIKLLSLEDISVSVELLVIPLQRVVNLLLRSEAQRVLMNDPIVACPAVKVSRMALISFLLSSSLPSLSR